MLGCLVNFARSLRVHGDFLLRLQLTRFGSFLLEARDASFGIYQLLAASKERVAARANFNAQVAFMRRTCPKCRSASTNHIYFVISGMNSCFHSFESFQSTAAHLRCK